MQNAIDVVKGLNFIWDAAFNVFYRLLAFIQFSSKFTDWLDKVELVYAVVKRK